MSVKPLIRLLNERGARIAVLVLIVALALDAALILTRLAGSAALPPATAPVRSSVAHTVNPQLRLANIVNAHLFGTAAVSAALDAPPTTMALILTGVIADRGHPDLGEAIIGSNAADAKLYTVGAVIPGNAHLHAVYSDRVLLERNGNLETLMLPRTPLPGLAPAAPAKTGRVAAQQGSLLAGLVRIQPVFSQGKLSGYRIFPGGKRGQAAFQQLGLRAGDLILSINGATLDDPARALQILQTLSSSGSASITVSRNGVAREVNLNLAELNQATDPGAAAQATQSAPSARPPLRRRPLGFRPPSHS